MSPAPPSMMPPGPRRRGMTLVELMLGLAITATIAGTISGLLLATSYGTTSRKEVRSVSTRLHVAHARLAAAMRSSEMILAQGDDFLVLWMADTRENDQPNLSELRRIERDPDMQVLRSYKSRPDLSDAEDTEYDLASTDFNAVTEDRRGDADFPEQRWATGVSAWAIDLDDSDPQQAARVSFRLTISEDEIRDTLAGAVALRNSERTNP